MNWVTIPVAFCRASGEIRITPKTVWSDPVRFMHPLAVAANRAIIDVLPYQKPQPNLAQSPAPTAIVGDIDPSHVHGAPYEPCRSKIYHGGQQTIKLRSRLYLGGP